MEETMIKGNESASALQCYAFHREGGWYALYLHDDAEAGAICRMQSYGNSLGDAPAIRGGGFGRRGKVFS